jgi:PAS domain S-box-containing protein
MIHMIKLARPGTAVRPLLALAAEPLLPDAVIGITRAGIVSSCNPPAVLLYGYLQEDMVGRAADVLCPPEVRAREAEILQLVISDGRTERYEANRVCKDGTVVAVSLTAAPIVSKAGTITGVTMASRTLAGWQDVHDQVEAGAESERRDSRAAQKRFDAKVDAERRAARDAQDQVEEEIESVRRDAWEIQDRFDARRDGERRAALEKNEQLQARLQQAQRLENLGQLAGGIAHDFNNLLAVIVNYATFVSEELDGASESDWAQRWETARGDVGQIKLAAERAARLTHQLLAFARREVVRPQVLDLDQVISGVAEMLRRTIGEHVELVTSLAGDLWPVLADPGQLEQVLVNLAVNARDAMPGGGTLTIETANITVDDGLHRRGSKALPGRNVRLRVSDSGTGMPADVIEHAFEPFFTTKPEGAGTGLGLATVYGIVSQAGGHDPDLLRARCRHDLQHHAAGHRGDSRAGGQHVPHQRSPKGRDHPGRRGRGTAARGDQADLRPQRLSRDHCRERPGSDRDCPRLPGRDPPARH